MEVAVEAKKEEIRFVCLFKYAGNGLNMIVLHTHCLNKILFNNITYSCVSSLSAIQIRFEGTFLFRFASTREHENISD